MEGFTKDQLRIAALCALASSKISKDGKSTPLPKATMLELLAVAGETHASLAKCTKVEVIRWAQKTLETIAAQTEQAPLPTTIDAAKLAYDAAVQAADVAYEKYFEAYKRGDSQANMLMLVVINRNLATAREVAEGLLNNLTEQAKIPGDVAGTLKSAESSLIDAQDSTWQAYDAELASALYEIKALKKQLTERDIRVIECDEYDNCTDLIEDLVDELKRANNALETARDRMDAAKDLFDKIKPVLRDKGFDV